MRLIDNWRELGPKLWSVKLSLLAAALSAIDAGVALYFDGRPLPALISCFVALSAAVARIVAQPVAVVKAAIEADRKEAAAQDVAPVPTTEVIYDALQKARSK